MADVLPSLPSSGSMNLAGAGTNGSASPILGSSFDIMHLQTYLEALLPILMSASPSAVQETLFGDRSWREMAESYATDASVTVVYVEKVRREAATTDSEDGEYEQGSHSKLAPDDRS